MPARFNRYFRPQVESLETRDTPSSSATFNVTTSNPAANPVSFNDASWAALHQQYSAQAATTKASVLFLGDSITQYWQTAGAYTWNSDFAPLGSINFGVAGDATQNILWRIENGELPAVQPKVVVLMAGTNNLTTTTEANVIGGIEAIVNEIRYQSPSSKVLVLGILPRGTEGSSLRSEITDVNRNLAMLDDGDAIRYADSGLQLLMNDGSIKPDVMPDGLHPSMRGYMVLGNVIQPLLREMLANPLPYQAAPVSNASNSSSSSNSTISVDWLNGPSGAPYSSSSWSAGNVSNVVWY